MLPLLLSNVGAYRCRVRMHSDRRRRNERKDPERKEAGSKLGYLCTQVWLITVVAGIGRAGESDEGRLRADRIFHPEGRMVEEGGWAVVSYSPRSESRLYLQAVTPTTI